MSLRQVRESVRTVLAVALAGVVGAVDGVVDAAAGFVLSLIVVVLAQAVAVRVARHRMSTTSGAVEEEGHPADTAPGALPPNPAPLEVVTVSANDPVPRSGSVQTVIRRTWLAGGVIAIGHVVAAGLFVAVWMLLASTADYGAPQVVMALAFATGAGFVLAIMAFAVLNISIQPVWFSAVLAVPSLLLSLVGVLVLDWRALLPWSIVPIGILLTYVARGRLGHRTGKLDLLVLRVFDSDSNVASLFDLLSRRWRHVGRVITIADPALVRYHFSPGNTSTRWRLVYIALLTAILGAVLRGGLGATVLAHLLAMPLVVIPVAVAVRASFVGSRSALARRIERLTGTRLQWHGAYEVRALYCRDDLWRPAVEMLLDGAEAVVMDLRGFGPGNEGCRYEIERLVARVPVSSIVVLVDENGAENGVAALFESAWRDVDAHSPNRGVEGSLRLYESSGRRSRTLGIRARLRADLGAARSWSRDSRRLVALLAAAALADGSELADTGA